MDMKCLCCYALVVLRLYSALHSPHLVVVLARLMSVALRMSVSRLTGRSGLPSVSDTQARLCVGAAR